MKPGLRQLFLPDLIRNTLMATIVASMALVPYSTVGLWMPLFLVQQHHWSTAEYGSFYISWALFSTTGFWLGGWMIDRLGRRLGFGLLLLEAAFFMTIWIFAEGKVALWLLGIGMGVRLHRRMGSGDGLYRRDVSDPHPRRRQWVFLVSGVPNRSSVVAVRFGLAARGDRLVRRRVPADPGDIGEYGGDHLVLQSGERPVRSLIRSRYKSWHSPTWLLESAW